jgi:heme A synthase
MTDQQIVRTGAETRSRAKRYPVAGYLLGAVLMVAAAVVAALWAVAAERKSLEEVARPLTSVE